MIESIPFIARARTVDHLGRGQIADCPTAISELWKNSYDAYAKNVTLHLFDGELPVAMLCDDGHGMYREELLNRWLVVGTESKAGGDHTPLKDRNGIVYRPKQGQKGIGRLSSGYLGPLLLLISKRHDHPYVACLIDWRLFENPYLYLSDIEIPIVTFEDKEELAVLTDGMLTKLIDNVWGHGDDDKRSRIKEAWRKFDEMQQAAGEDLSTGTTREAIERLAVESPFLDRHLSKWEVWNESVNSGTAMVVADIDFDLRAQLEPSSTTDSTTKRAQNKFFEILSSFSDPFPAPGVLDQSESIKDFDCSVIAWKGDDCRLIIGREKEFDLSVIRDMEHILDGRVDEKGEFRGRVKAFGKWLEGDITIQLHGNVDLPKRSDTKVGEFNIYIAAIEFDRQNSTHTPEQHAKYRDLATLYSGFMIYRDGLRVMPYGRSSNDFFEIEQRRSKHAGREFWNLRQMFGRISITRSENPNLRDKAGREGIIDNRSAKGLKDIVENILKTSARRFFGSQSDIRAKILPDLKAAYIQKKEEEERKKLGVQQRRLFVRQLNDWSGAMEKLVEQVDEIAGQIDTGYSDLVEDDVMSLRSSISDFKDKFSSMKIVSPPKVLGPLKDKYKQFRLDQNYVRSKSAEIGERLQARLVELKPKLPAEIAKADLQIHLNQLRRKLRGWNKQVSEILSSEEKRLYEMANHRVISYESQMLVVIEDVRAGRAKLDDAMNEFAKEREVVDEENEDLYVPYINALDSLRLSIDLSALASSDLNEFSDLREELDRLTALAQLGITVEIIGHELEGFDAAVTSGLNSLPEEMVHSKAIKRIREGHEGLTERLKFLSPLKLSGQDLKTWFTGEDILSYLNTFFGDKLIADEITLRLTEEFREFRIFEKKSRIYPVFVNLINNARYWVCQSEGDRIISIHADDNKVIVSDSGPGVESDDVKELFKLFFTRRRLGGRGVGLYLCRANLGSAGHKIHYVQGGHYKILKGANFVIEFSS